MAEIKEVKKISRDELDRLLKDLTKVAPDLVDHAFNNYESRNELKNLVKSRNAELFASDSDGELLEYVMAETVGLAFIERVLRKEPDVTDIRFNGTFLTIKTNREKYIYEDEEVTEQDVITLAKRFANQTGKDFTEKETRLNAQFDYMRVNAIERKNAPYGTTMAIRISQPKLVVTEENFDTLADMYVLDLCKLLMKTGQNIILSGIPGSGKTELTKTLMGYLNFLDVIITIEDTPEGHFKTLFPHLDITSWYTSTNVTESDLIAEALRNDCDWLMVTETRTAPAAYALFKGFLTGAHGVTSIHADSAGAIPNRYYNMIKDGIDMDKESFLDDFYRTGIMGFHQKREWLNGQIVRYIDEIVEFTEDHKQRTIYRRWLEDGIFYSDNPNPLSDKLVSEMLAKNLDITPLEDTKLLPESYQTETEVV